MDVKYGRVVVLMAKEKKMPTLACLPAPLQVHIDIMTNALAITKLTMNILKQPGPTTFVRRPESPKKMAQIAPGIHTRIKAHTTP